jgi:hypothetical protein
MAVEVFVRGRSPSELYISLACSTPSRARSCFYPRERFTMERPNTIQLARCYRAILLQGRETGKARGPFIPRLKTLTFTHIFVNPGPDAPGTAEVPRAIQLGFPRFDGLGIRRTIKMWVMIRAKDRGMNGPLSVTRGTASCSPTGLERLIPAALLGNYPGNCVTASCCSSSQKGGQRATPGSLALTSYASQSPSGVTTSGLSR